MVAVGENRISTEASNTLDTLNAESDAAREPSAEALKFMRDHHFEPDSWEERFEFGYMLDAFAAQAMTAANEECARICDELRENTHSTADNKAWAAARQDALHHAVNLIRDKAQTAARVKPAAKCYRCGSSEHYIENCPLIGPAAAVAASDLEQAKRLADLPDMDTSNRILFADHIAAALAEARREERERVVEVIQTFSETYPSHLSANGLQVLLIAIEKDNA